MLSKHREKLRLMLSKHKKYIVQLCDGHTSWNENQERYENISMYSLPKEGRQIKERLVTKKCVVLQSLNSHRFKISTEKVDVHSLPIKNIRVVHLAGQCTTHFLYSRLKITKCEMHCHSLPIV